MSPSPASKPAPAAPGAAAFFARKHVLWLALLLAALAAGALCSAVVGFSPALAVQKIPSSLAWMAQSFVPTAQSLAKLPVIGQALLTTVFDSAAAAFTGAVLAYLCALAGTRSVGLGGAAQLLVRAVASVMRNIPTVAWAFILLCAFKQSEFTGYLALFFKSFGFLTRTYLEAMDEVDQGPLEALRAAGATRLQLMAHAVIPLTSTQIVSWLLYMFETNVRNATLVGMLTGTGIGFVFTMYYRGFRYDEAGLVILSVAAMVIVCEVASNYVRRRVK
ncbi:MAG: PhnE/PtxC family ABC transporter permease [Coriobacteriales bacterium]